MDSVDQYAACWRFRTREAFLTCKSCGHTERSEELSALGNVKLPADDEEHIVPFLRRIKQAYDIPLALVHDMGKGILKTVATVFPEVPDFICHFHFLRDIGKDFLVTQYDTICKRVSKHGRCLAKARLSRSKRGSSSALRNR